VRASIIIASDHRGQALARTAESCLQEAPSLGCEVIAAVDAPSDEWIRQVEWQFPEARFIRHEKNGGSSASRALGAEHANGDVLIFVQAGSQLERNALERLIRGAEHVDGTAIVTPCVRPLALNGGNQKPTEVLHGQLPDLLTLSWRPVARGELRRTRAYEFELYDSPAPIGMPVAMSRDLHDAVLGFSACVGDNGCDYLHLGLKAWLLGFRIVHDPEAVVAQPRVPLASTPKSLAERVADQIRIARINFCPEVWEAWVDECRERNRQDLLDHPEGLWAYAWRLFETARSDVEEERRYVQGRRARDEFWYSRHFGLAWPQLEDQHTVARATGTTGNATAPAIAAGARAAGVTPSPSPGPRVVNPVLSAASPVVIVAKTYTSPTRQRVTLRTSAPFPRSGTLARSGIAIRFFTAAAGGQEITFDGTDNVFSGARLTAGVELFAQGAQASAAMNDTRLTLTLAPGGNPGVGPPAVVTMTAVELTLDICMTRTAAGVDPAPLPQPPPAPPATPTDKWFGGRAVHVQDTGHHHGRALLIVRQVQPAAFAGVLELRAVSVAGNVVGALTAGVHAFDNETFSAGETAKPNPFEIQASTVPAAGQRLWVEGATVSGSLRDTGFQLGIKGVDNDGDRVRVTVVRLKNLIADIPSTPAHTARLGNSPVDRHTLTRGAAAAPNASDYSEDFTANPPLVLLEDGIAPGSPVNLSVAIDPAGVPVSWSVLRDTRSAPDGDAAGVVALSPNAVPTLAQSAADSRQATLQSDAVGSFYIRPYVDVNGNGSFDRGIDTEPFMILPLVLVRVTQNQDNSAAQNNFQVAPATDAANNPIPGTISVTSGTFDIAHPGNAALFFSVRADVVGGGGDGLRGVDRVFAGWVNNETAAEDVAGTFNDSSVAPPVVHRSFSIFASNRAAATGGTATSPVFVPGNPAPALVAPPLLDTGRQPSPGIGGDSACLTRSQITSRNNLALGQRFLIEAVDSPGDGDGPTDPGFPAAQLVGFRLGLTFGAFLCFWTNLAAVSGPTADPANRLYSVLTQLAWQIRGEWSINPATGAIVVVTAPSVQITARSPSTPATAASRTTAEVRSPTGLGLLARDART